MRLAHRINAPSVGRYSVMAASALFALGLIGSDIASVSGWHWPLFTGGDSTPTPGELGDYTQFTTVFAGEIKVVTGKRFSLVPERILVEQWCYAAPAQTRPASVSFHLSLDDLSGAGRTADRPFSAQDLSLIGLTQVEAQALYARCQFERPLA